MQNTKETNQQWPLLISNVRTQNWDLSQNIFCVPNTVWSLWFRVWYGTAADSLGISGIVSAWNSRTSQRNERLWADISDHHLQTLWGHRRKPLTFLRSRSRKQTLESPVNYTTTFVWHCRPSCSCRITAVHLHKVQSGLTVVISNCRLSGWESASPRNSAPCDCVIWDNIDLGALSVVRVNRWLWKWVLDFWLWGQCLL